MVSCLLTRMIEQFISKSLRGNSERLHDEQIKPNIGKRIQLDAKDIDRQTSGACKGNRGYQ